MSNSQGALPAIRQHQIRARTKTGTTRPRTRQRRGQKCRKSAVVDARLRFTDAGVVPTNPRKLPRWPHKVHPHLPDRGTILPRKPKLKMTPHSPLRNPILPALQLEVDLDECSEARGAPLGFRSSWSSMSQGGGVIKRVNSSGPGSPGAGIEKVLREYRFLQKQTKCRQKDCPKIWVLRPCLSA